MRLGLISLAWVAALAAMSPAQALEPPMDVSNDRWINVTGEGSVSAAPDFAEVTLGVTSTGKKAGDAVAANAQAANALAALIRSEGVAPADIQTSSVSVSPVFSRVEPNQQTAPTVTGYSVSNNVSVRVRDLPRLGALIDKAVTAGANTIYGISFGHNDFSALLDKARPLAVADARRKAEIYAAAGGGKIGRLMVLTEDGGIRQSPMAFSRAYDAVPAPPPTPIEAGEDKLTVSVNARFELTQ
jgi:uncharacterized protein